MPEGTRHTFTGKLHTTESGLVLRLSDKREWKLAGAGLERFEGQRVRGEGMRGEDDILYVTSCAPASKLSARF